MKIVIHHSLIVINLFVAYYQAGISCQRMCSFQPPWRLNATSDPTPYEWEIDELPIMRDNRLCSVRNRYFYKDAEHFHLHTAAECFFFTAAKYLPRRPCLALPYVCLNGNARSFREGDCYLPDAEDHSEGLGLALEGNPGAKFRWVSCVKGAVGESTWHTWLG